MICQTINECINSIQRVVPSHVKKKKQDFRVSFSQYPCHNNVNASKCVLFLDNRQKPTCAENGKKYTLELGYHSYDCLGLHIDGGVIDSGDCRKCDYAFYVKDTDKRFILIELKGHNTEAAIDQLMQTLNREELKHVISNCKVYGRISAIGSIPRIQSLNHMKLQKQFLMHGGNLKIYNSPFIEKYTDIDKILP